MRAVALMVMSMLACATSTPTALRGAYDVPDDLTAPVPLFPVVLATTQQLYQVESTRPNRGGVLTAPFADDGKSVSFVVQVRTLDQSAVRRHPEVHVEVVVTIKVLVDDNETAIESTSPNVRSRAHDLLAAISRAVEAYAAPSRFEMWPDDERRRH